MAKTGYSAVKQVAASYWYKIGGKTVTKAQYNAHSNKTGDGPTKSTNDPDASGNKSKTENNRSKNKESKKSTVLTKAQTEAKNKKNPKPKKSTESAHGQLDDAEAEYQQDLKDHAAKKKTPLKWGWKDTLDAAQTGLTAAGMIPGFGNIADGINTAVSGGRAGYASLTGNKGDAKKYRNDMLLNAAMMVPGAGQLVAGTKLAKGTKNVYNAVKNSNKVVNKVAKGGENVVKAGNKIYKGNTKSKKTYGVVGDPSSGKNASTYYNIVSGKTVAKTNKLDTGEKQINNAIAKNKEKNNRKTITIKKGADTSSNKA